MEDLEKRIDGILDAVQELTKQTAEMAKQLKQFKEVYEKYQKAGKFTWIFWLGGALWVLAHVAAA